MGEWQFIARTGPILHSKCKQRQVCQDAKAGDVVDDEKMCLLCRYIHNLQLPSHPDMTFAYSLLRVEHKSGAGFEFNPLDALKCVSEKNYIPKVAIADAWRESRQTPDHPQPTVTNMFDWTFTTDYSGSIVPGKNGKRLKVTETTERIDLSKLTSREPIDFYQDVCLFEDELSDHGVAKLNVKIRCMRNNFFILLRFFLRVDQVLIRMNDTRIYYEMGKDYLLREYTSKEERDAKNLNVPTAVLTDPVALSEHLPVTQTLYHKLEIV